MNKTKIEWCDYTWNPVTGCLQDCPYCYARSIAKRFGTRKNAYWDTSQGIIFHWNGVDMPVLQSPIEFLAESEDGGCSGFPIGINSFPAGFTPTYHRYRLSEPQKLKKPSNIFVVSMGGLFGEWVPDEWIKAVFKACEAAPQHRYLFLTKNPRRIEKLADKDMLPKGERFWYGSTIDALNTFSALHSFRTDLFTFISFEPLLSEPKNLRIKNGLINWVIIGAETGNRKDKITPKREWVENIVTQCSAAGVPVFMKDSLAEIYGEPLIREFPWAT